MLFSRKKCNVYKKMWSKLVINCDHNTKTDGGLPMVGDVMSACAPISSVADAGEWAMQVSPITCGSN